MSEEQYHHVLNLTKALWRVTDLFSRDDGVLVRHIREKASEIFSCMVEFGYSGQYEHEHENIQAKIKSLIGFLELARLMKCVKPINIALLSKEYGDLQHFFEQKLLHKEENKIPPNLPLQKGGDGKDTIPPNLPLQKGGDESEIISPNLPSRKASLQKEEDDSKPLLRKKMEGKIVSSKQEKTGEQSNDTHIPIPIQKLQHSFPKENSSLNNRQKTIITHMKEVTQAKVSDFYEMFSKISTKTVQRDLQCLVTKNILKKEGEKRWTMYSIVS